METKQKNLLSQAVHDAIGVAVVADDAATKAWYAAAVALHEANVKTEHLDKDHPKYNEALVREIQLAIVAKFPANARATIVKAMNGIAETDKQLSDIRHLYKATLRKNFKSIRDNLAKVEDLIRNGGRHSVTLHEALAKLLDNGIQRIQKNKGDKGEPLEVLLAAFKDCRAKCNAAFKGATK